MSHKNGATSLIQYILTVFLVFGLLFSFALHSIQVEHSHVDGSHQTGKEHHHKSAFGDLDTYMHLSDKKLLLIVSLLLLHPLTFLRKRIRIRELMLLFAFRTASRHYHEYGAQHRVFSYLSCLFRKGIFHSKAY